MTYHYRYQMSNNNKLQLYTPTTDMVMARLRSPKVKDTPEPAAQEMLTNMIEGVCLIRGVKAQEVGVTLMAALLSGQMRTDPQVGDLTWEEVAKALQEGSFGRYGEVYGVNAASIYAMLNGYLQSGDKVELSLKVRSLHMEQQRKDQERISQFLADHSGYAKIIIDNFKEQQQPNK